MSATAGSVIGFSLLTAGAVFALYKLFEPNLAGTPTNNDGTIESLKLVDPYGPEVQFILYTRNNSPYNIQLQNFEALNNSGFNVNNPTKIITHGFLSNIENDVFNLPKNAYLQIGDFNIIGMDWSVLCQTEYLSAMRGAKIAGQQLGDFINWLTSNGVTLDSIHLIGHSLGAHVAAMAGDSILEGRVGRITGLDPAGPGFGDVKEEFRLDPEDAQLVDVVHTYMKIIGTSRPSGHVDFYPNGGRYQPGCPDLTSLTNSVFCNHGRSYELFAESIINPKAFKSKKCKNLKDALDSRCLENTDVYMGQPDTYKNGIYYFRTRPFSPYSTGATKNATKLM